MKRNDKYSLVIYEIWSLWNMIEKYLPIEEADIIYLKYLILCLFSDYLLEMMTVVSDIPVSLLNDYCLTWWAF